MGKNTRTENTVRNVKAGVVNRVIIMVLPFVTRTLIIYLLGADYLGIGTLYTSILSFLSLAELGFSSSIVYAMYKPIAENDENAICALLKYFKKLYTIIGWVMLFVGTIIVPAVPYFINGDPPEGINVYILYYIYLINSVISYFFLGYRQSILQAYQRQDIITKISSVINPVFQILQILVIFYSRNFYAYAVVPLLSTVANNITNSLIVKKKYPNLVCKGQVSYEVKKTIKSKISGLLGTRLNSIVVHSADTLIVSAFLGLTATAEYGNYYIIFNTICGFIMIIFSSMTSSVGNKIVKDSIEENLKLFKTIEFGNVWLVGFCSVCLMCLYEPFMSIWVGSELCLGKVFSVLMALYFYLYEVQRTILTYKDAAGIWREDRFRPYCTMVVNLGSNIVLVKLIGIYGIVLSTIIAFAISLPWANKVLFETLFKFSGKENLFYILKGLLVTTLASIITFYLCNFLPINIEYLLIRITICMIVPNIVFWLFYNKCNEYNILRDMVLRRLKKCRIFK